jgi:hypothetical protein
MVGIYKIYKSFMSIKLYAALAIWTCIDKTITWGERRKSFNRCMWERSFIPMTFISHKLHLIISLGKLCIETNLTLNSMLYNKCDKSFNSILHPIPNCKLFRYFSGFTNFAFHLDIHYVYTSCIVKVMNNLEKSKWPIYKTPSFIFVCQHHHSIIHITCICKLSVTLRVTFHQQSR